MTNSPGKVKSSHNSESNHSASPPSPSNWLDRLGRIWLAVSRFVWDVLGVILLALALVLLLGLFGLTEGSVLTPLIQAVDHGFGWGGFLVVAFLAALGLLSLRRGGQDYSPLSASKIIMVEGAGFALLALLALASGVSLERAEQGLDGGLVGWGLATLAGKIFPGVLAIIFFGFVFLLLTFFGLGLGAKVDGWIEAWLRTPEPLQTIAIDDAPSPKMDQPVKIPSTASTGRVRVAKQTGGGVSSVSVNRRDERLPPFNLLGSEPSGQVDESHIHETAELLEKALAEFGIPARVVGYRVGPTVTQFAVEPGYIEKPGPDGEIIQQKIRVSQISALSRDLALRLSAERLRIEAPVPGRSFVGIEVPNRRTSVVRLRPILQSETFQKLNAPLAIALGQDVSGLPVVADLARMPHLLIAGTTGSGKSVCISALTTTLVMNNTPDELRLAILDPKMVELVRFNGLPHLLGRVETEIDRMLGVLRWAIAEMDHRYRLLEEARVRDLEGYNRKLERRKLAALPRIVILIDELADLMMSAPDQTEQCLVRLAQMARATGIHLVVATQRPSTDVVTGLIKANFPARISFTVASSIDSRVILDTGGAETLLGRGDMLFLNPELGTPIRTQGVFVTDSEQEKVINFWRKMRPVDQQVEAPWESLLASDIEDGDKLVEEAIKVLRSTQRASTSLLQRRLRIGYPRAANLMEQLESMGVVGPAQGGGREREVLLPPEEDKENSEGEN